MVPLLAGPMPTWVRPMLRLLAYVVLAVALGVLAMWCTACGGSSDGGSDGDGAAPTESCRSDAGCDDAYEDPRGCDATPHPGMIALQTAGEGVDLIVAQYAACDCCYGCEVAIRIANAGSAPLEAAVRVEVLPSRQAYEQLRASGQEGIATSFHFEEPLAPGQVSEPVIRYAGLGRSEQRDGYFIAVDPFDEIPESDESNNELEADGSDILICF
jgi:hypothetical protein